MDLRIGATSMMMFQNMVRVSGAGFVTQAKADEISSFWKSKQAQLPKEREREKRKTIRETHSVIYIYILTCIILHHFNTVYILVFLFSYNREIESKNE